jgi:hypothetical protein
VVRKALQLHILLEALFSHLDFEQFSHAPNSNRLAKPPIFPLNILPVLSAHQPPETFASSQYLDPIRKPSSRLFIPIRICRIWGPEITTSSYVWVVPTEGWAWQGHRDRVCETAARCHHMYDGEEQICNGLGPCLDRLVRLRDSSCTIIYICSSAHLR